MLAEKAGTLDLKNIKKNNIGATKKGDRKARLANAPAGDSAGNQTQQGFMQFLNSLNLEILFNVMIPPTAVPEG